MNLTAALEQYFNSEVDLESVRISNIQFTMDKSNNYCLFFTIDLYYNDNLVQIMINDIRIRELIVNLLYTRMIHVHDNTLLVESKDSNLLLDNLKDLDLYKKRGNKIIIPIARDGYLPRTNHEFCNYIVNH